MNLRTMKVSLRSMIFCFLVNKALELVERKRRICDKFFASNML